jgi:hypothetical protein
MAKNLKTTTAVQPPTPAVALVDVDVLGNRIYRGQDPSRQPVDRGAPGTVVLQDRVEVVRFLNPGTYLVICGVLPHFQGSATQYPMFGFVTVK